MTAGKINKGGGDKRRYRFIVAVSLSALEEEVNRVAEAEPCLKLNQVLYVMGSGYVAVMERSEYSGEAAPEPGGPLKEQAGIRQKPRKKS